MGEPAPTPRSRRERFRSIMRGLDGSGAPADALEQGFYRDRPDGVAQLLAMSLEIRPHGRHLVVGSIGSGKTTELRRVEQLLNEVGDTAVHYLDVGEPIDRGYRGPGLDLTFEAARAAGAIDGDTLTAVPAQMAGSVALLDGFDRWSPEVFRSTIAESMATFPKDVGLVCVGPPQLLADGASLEGDYFEQVHYCGAVDPSSHEGIQFLTQVLVQRTDGFLDNDAVVVPLIRASGGILRDLLLLARVATEEAYVHGHDQLEPEDGRAAILRFLDSMFRGIEESDLALLEHFDDASESIPLEKLEAFIARRAILPTYQPTLRFTVHPLLKDVLDKRRKGRVRA